MGDAAAAADDDLAPVLARNMSIGDATFAERLQVGQGIAAAGIVRANDDVLGMEENDRQEDIEADFELSPQLRPMPARTQEVTFTGDDDDDEEMPTASDKETCKALFATLNAKSYRLKDRAAALYKLNEGGIPDPYAILETMHSSIEAMEEGDERTQNCHMLNALITVFESARTNPGLRNFASTLFSTQKAYYEYRIEKRAIKKEMAVLNELYDEQEDELQQEALKKKQQERRAMLMNKGEAKAKQDTLKAEAAAKAKAESAAKKRKD